MSSRTRETGSGRDRYRRPCTPLNRGENILIVFMNNAVWYDLQDKWRPPLLPGMDNTTSPDGR
ncbi:MAG: hypothetical protein IPI66_15840 [Chitinophagaceae bacterium]|nr:hypothetical protein [Chitinophagaceae bacterium]